MSKQYDYIIIGAGIMGLSIAYALKEVHLGAKILIIDKEEIIAAHASSRNSGVLHAGFYYSADSFKAKFTVEGNKAMKGYCLSKNIPVNDCGKLVVAQNEQELQGLKELHARGKNNGSNVKLIDEDEAKTIEPNIRTFKKALYSPDTASIDPKEVCNSLKDDLVAEGVKFKLKTKYIGKKDQTILTDQGEFTAGKLINCAGLYADKIAQDCGFGSGYTMIPFKGLYLKYTKNTTDVKVNIYPVPNLNNPFLGVHFTKTVDGGIKIGPTAIPALWRENYKGTEKFVFSEFCDIALQESKLFLTNAFHFRDLAFEESRKYNKKYFISLAAKMVQDIDIKGFTEFTRPGIRAQLLNKKTLKLEQDFVVEGDQYTTHILNAVSPAFTCSFVFAKYVVDKYIFQS